MTDIVSVNRPSSTSLNQQQNQQQTHSTVATNHNSHNSQSRDNISLSKPVTSTRALVDMALVKQTVENILSKGVQGLTLRKLRRKCECIMQIPVNALDPHKKDIKSIFMNCIGS